MLRSLWNLKARRAAVWSLPALSIAAVAMIAVSALGGTSAFAQSVPTKGESKAASGGQARTVFIGDLKKFATPPPGGGVCGSAFGGYVVCEGDYDDDPGANPQFHVAPNNGDSPLQHAWKVLVFDFHPVGDPNGTALNDIRAIQKEIFWTAAAHTGGPDSNANGQRVLHEVVNYRDPVTGAVIPNVILTGAQCNTLGTPGVDGTIADGIVETGQATGAEVNAWLGDCIQAEAGFHLNNWTVSKHLPPGTYNQCVTLIHTSGAQTPVECRPFVIVPTVHYAVDFQAVSWQNLATNNTSVQSGDFVFGSGNPTIQGDGNTSLVYGVRYTRIVTPSGKTICNDFDSQINRRGPVNPTLPIEWEHIDGIVAPCTGTGEAAYSPWVDFDGPTTLGAALGGTSGAVCLEPNEPLKLDFSVTPKQTVFDTAVEGAYTGTVQIRAQVNTAVCTPSLDHGEHTGGDNSAGGVFDNNPSQGGPLPFP